MAIYYIVLFCIYYILSAVLVACIIFPLLLLNNDNQCIFFCDRCLCDLELCMKRSAWRLCFSVIDRRWSSCVWSVCRSTSSSVRLGWAIARRPAARGQGSPVSVSGDTSRTRALTLCRPHAHTEEEDVDAKLTMRTLAMVRLQLPWCSSVLNSLSDL